MKKIVKYLLLLILMSPIYTYALSYANYNDSIKAVNSYMNRYSDRNKYIMFDAKYDFTNGMPTTNTDFKKGGLLTRDEYLLSKGSKTSYLTMGKEFWTMTENVNNQHFYIDYDILSKSNGAYSGARVTEYVKPDTEVGGKGSYSNPWVFLLSYKINLKVNSSKYGSVSPESAHVKPNGTLGNVEITEKPGYSYDNNDCGLVFVRNKDTFTNIYEKRNITRDTTCIITFKKKVIKISYSCNGGTNPPSSQTVTYGNQYSIAGYDVCKRQGYSQTGWVTSDGNAWEAGNYDKFEVENGQRGVNNNELKLKAVWNAKTYAVTLDKNGGTGGTNSYDATYDQMVQNVTIPLKEGYKFISYTLNTKVYHNETGVGQRKYDETSDSTFKANYEKCTNIGYEYVSEWENNNNCEINSCKPGFDLVNNTCVGKTFTATFNKNGATSIGSSSVNCTVADESGKCSIVLPSITRSGFTIDGWSNTASSTSGTAVGSTVTLTANTTYYAITHKAVTITFNRNGNTSQTPSGGSASTANSVTQSCTIRNSATTCSITSPTITAPSGYNVTGYSTASGTHTSSWSHNSIKAVSASASYYAQSVKVGKTITITFNKNGNTSQTPKGGSASTANTVTQSCTLGDSYNGAAASDSCKITSPTITAPSGFNVIGYSTASGTHTSSWNQNTEKTVTASATYYAQSGNTAIDRKITFYKNGNTSFTYGGTTYTDASKQFTICSVPSSYNGASQGTSCTATITMPTITAPSGFTNIGWSNASGTHTATYTSGQASVKLTLSANVEYYAQSKKEAKTITVTFNKNGNTSQTKSGGTASTAETITATCTIPIVYNGSTQGNSCSITSPTITAPSGFTVIGYSTASGTHTSSWNQGTAKSLSSNATYYAQSSKAGKTITVTFDRNKTDLYGTKQQTKNGSSTASTADSITDSCTIATVYNGASQSTSCSITSPEIGPHSGYSVIGYNTSSTATTSSWNHKTAKNISSNTTYYSITKINDPATPTITNPKNNTWTNADISITVSTSSPSSIIGKWYYKYGTGSWKEWTGRDGKDSETYTETNEKNTTVYFKVCNIRATGESDSDNCSDSASTVVKIDKTPPVINNFSFVALECSTTPYCTIYQSNNCANKNWSGTASTNSCSASYRARPTEFAYDRGFDISDSGSGINTSAYPYQYKIVWNHPNTGSDSTMCHVEIASPPFSTNNCICGSDPNSYVDPVRCNYGLASPYNATWMDEYIKTADNAGNVTKMKLRINVTRNM